jgi:hypothetical protein
MTQDRMRTNSSIEGKTTAQGDHFVVMSFLDQIDVYHVLDQLVVFL